jgi:hypothetical protein
MNTRAFALIASTFAVLAAGCAPDRMSLEVKTFCAPTVDCTFGATCTTQYLGTYAVDSASGLWLFMQVDNQLADNSDIGTMRVNSNDAHVTGATISFAGARGGSVTLPTVANQAVPAAGSAVIGIMIPSGGVPGVVTAQIRLTGYYDNGREFETGDIPLNYVIVAVGALGTCTTTQACPPGDGTANVLQTPSTCI